MTVMWAASVLNIQFWATAHTVSWRITADYTILLVLLNNNNNNNNNNIIIILIIFLPFVVRIPRIRSYQNLKQNSWMAKGPGPHHSQTTHAAKLHWNAPKRSRVVDTRIVPPCCRKRLTRFCGPNYSEIPQPIGWLGPEFPMLSAEPDRQLTTTTY